MLLSSLKMWRKLVETSTRRSNRRRKLEQVCAAEVLEDRCLLSGLGLVADNATHSVVVFDSDTNTALGSVVLPGRNGATGDVAITDDASLGFVTDFGFHVWVIDLADPTHPTVEPTPIAISNFGEDIAIAPDQQFLVVSDGGAPEPLSVVNISSRTEIGTFSLGSGADADSVEVSETGSVLATSFSSASVRRLTIDGSGTLTDTGEVLSVSSPVNVYAAPGGTFGVVVSRTGFIQSFGIAGLTPVDSASTGTSVIAAVFNAAGDRVYVREGVGLVHAFSFDPATGDLSSAPLFSITVSSAPTFGGMDQLTLSPDGTRLYVPEDAADAVKVYDATDGTFLASITHANIQAPTGITIVDTGLSVTGTDPANGSVVVGNTPTQYIVNVSESLVASTVDASDFEVNGIEATSVSYTPGTTTITFTFANDPVAAQGVQTTHVASDAFVSASGGTGVTEFNGRFRWDAVLMQVTSTDPAEGSVLLLPATTLDLNFNEAYDFSSAQPSDFVLNQGSVSAVSQVDADTLRLTLDGVTQEGDASLTVNMAAGAMTDAYGNPGAAFAGGYILDFGSKPYPVPLTPKAPLGSLIYDPSAAGVISPSGDTDTFTISVDPGQTLTVDVHSDANLQASVTLLAGASGNNVLATGAAAAPGDEVVLQPVATNGQLAGGSASKTYRIVVAGANGTTGSYTVQMVLNAALEDESHGGASNDTLDTAQDLEPSFLQLHRASNADNSGAQPARGAVLGIADGAGGYEADAVPYTFEEISGTGTATLDDTDDSTFTLSAGQLGTFAFPFYGNSYTNVSYSTNGLITFNGAYDSYSNQNLTTSPSQAAVSPFWDDLETFEGGTVYWQVSGSGADQHLTIEWRDVYYFYVSPGTITFEAQLYADGRIQFNYQDLVGGVSNDNGTSATVGIKDAGTQGPNRLLLAYNNGPNEYVGTGQSTLIVPVTPTADYYSFHLDAGASATIAVTGQDEGALNLELLDSTGAVIATGTNADNLTSVVSDFIASSAGTYFVRITGEKIDYSLLVTRNAGFDTEDNNDIASAQEVLSTQVAGGQWTLGYVNLNPAVTGVVSEIEPNDPLVNAQNLDTAEWSLADNPDIESSTTIPHVSVQGELSFSESRVDFYSFTVSNAGDTAIFDIDHTLILDTRLFLLDTTGNLLAFNGGGGGDPGSSNFRDPRIYYTFSAPGTYIIDVLRAGSIFGTYTLQVSVQDHAAATSGPNGDFYQVTLAEGGTLEVATATPGAGGGEFGNQFDPAVRVYDADGNLVASDDNSADDGRNALLAYAVPAGGAGTYYVEVTASDATPEPTTGEYILSIAGNVAGDNLYAAGDAVAGASTAGTLTDAALQSAVANAIGYWQATGVDTSPLGSISVRSADLVGSMLGHAFDDAIVIDSNAAGYGWSFGSGGLSGSIDLQSTLIHEFGHELGFEHTAGGVMSASLAPGSSLLSDSFGNALSGSDAPASTFNVIPVSVLSAVPQSATMDEVTNALVWSSAGRSLEPALADPIASIKDELLTYSLDESAVDVPTMVPVVDDSFNPAALFADFDNLLNDLLAD
jgi:Bacterial pre-peptidase C-terminal domain/Bacterial Ig-like domain